MNKHTKLVVSLLFGVLIILAAAVTRFYFITPDETGSGGNQTDIVRKLASDSSGNRIFESGNGYFGIADVKDRIIVAPEWTELEFANGSLCTASRKIGNKMLSGCIDYEGNIEVPFIYRSISRHETGGQVFYIADSDSDSSYVIYDENFVPCFGRSWNECKVNENEIILRSDTGTYSYAVNESGFIFRNAAVYGETLECEYSVDIYSRVILSKLSTVMLEDIVSDIGKYIEFAYTGNDEPLSGITTGSRSGFRQIFPDDHRILSKKLLGISEIYIYSKKSESGIPHYAAAVTAETEITYTDETGEEKTFTDGYKADIEFSGSSANNLMAVSGRFRLSEPEYPADYGIQQTFLSTESRRNPDKHESSENQ